MYTFAWSGSWMPILFAYRPPWKFIFTWNSTWNVALHEVAHYCSFYSSRILWGLKISHKALLLRTGSLNRIAPILLFYINLNYGRHISCKLFQFSVHSINVINLSLGFLFPPFHKHCIINYYCPDLFLTKNRLRKSIRIKIRKKYPFAEKVL